jgi:hypothetical protein
MHFLCISSKLSCDFLTGTSSQLLTGRAEPKKKEGKWQTKYCNVSNLVGLTHINYESAITIGHPGNKQLKKSQLSYGQSANFQNIILLFLVKFFFMKILYLLKSYLRPAEKGFSN